MEKVRLLKNEILIKELKVEMGFENGGKNISFSNWQDINLAFTSKRVHINSNSESVSHSYDNISGIQFIANELPFHKKYIAIIIPFIIVFVIAVVYELWLLLTLTFVAVFLLGAISNFFNIKTYRVSFVSQTSDELIAFDIKRDRAMKEEIQDAFESGKQNNSE